MPDALAITGPTASGKTAVAVEVARRLDGEVISMDSRQVYRHMRIGTARPDEAELGGIPHHGFDLVDPDERFNAGAFAKLARGWIADIRGRGRVPVLAGGTGFFLRALTHPMFEEPPQDPSRKEAWKRALREFDTDRLRRWAETLEPHARPLPRDRQRLARLIEVALLTGRPLSWWHREQAGHAEPAGCDVVAFVLDVPADVLRDRIDRRVDAMLAAGLAGEVRALMALGYDERDPGMNSTGYVELIPYVRGECTIEDAAKRVRSATRRYARRQRTWFRHQLPGAHYVIDGNRDPASVAADIVRTWNEVHA